MSVNADGFGFYAPCLTAECKSRHFVTLDDDSTMSPLLAIHCNGCGLLFTVEGATKGDDGQWRLCLKIALTPEQLLTSITEEVEGRCQN